ncbi:MAG: DOMON domain-containing protein [Spirochaetales bacterium]|nr:DOMON domain-containing protein [Spirochaetales bacterium]
MKRHIALILVSLAATALPLAGESVTVSGITFEWSIDGTDLTGTLRSSEKGWVAVGFNPTSIMEGADFIIGYVDKGEVFIRDDYGNRRTSHTPDTRGGGSDNVTAVSGSESSAGTVITFRIPLDSGDERDHKFVNGQSIPVIFAASRSDNFTGIHNMRGKTEITFRW